MFCVLGVVLQTILDVYNCFTCIVSLYRNDPTPRNIDRWLVFQTLYIYIYIYFTITGPFCYPIPLFQIYLCTCICCVETDTMMQIFNTVNDNKQCQKSIGNGCSIFQQVHITSLSEIVEIWWNEDYFKQTWYF